MSPQRFICFCDELQTDSLLSPIRLRNTVQAGSRCPSDLQKIMQSWRTIDPWARIERRGSILSCGPGLGTRSANPMGRQETFSSLWQKSSFERARLQSCRKRLRINAALAAAGRFSRIFHFHHRLLGRDPSPLRSIESEHLGKQAQDCIFKMCSLQIIQGK